MKYRIKKVTYGDGRTVYFAQYRNREFDDEIKKIMLASLLIIPLIAVLPALLVRMFYWEDLYEGGDAVLAQNYICDHKLKIRNRKIRESEERLASKKIKSVELPLKECDHENRG